MNKRKLIPFVLLNFFLVSLSCFAAEDNHPLPGRLGSSQISVAQFGNTRLYFYMTPEKYQIAKKFVRDVSENMIHTVVLGELDFPVVEVTPVASEYDTPIGFDENNQPQYVDQQGTLIYQNHAKDVRNIAEKTLGIKIHGLSQQMSMIMNFDANKFHQDQFITQYNFLENHAKPIPEYILVQDLTLIDWEMSKGTFSATLLQDEESEDRFIIPLFQNEVACTVYTEPAIYLGPYTHPKYPGAATLPPHCPIAPIDRNGDCTSGSSKGKRISVAVRGLVHKAEMDDLYSRSHVLAINRYEKTKLSGDDILHTYPNGIKIQKFTKDRIQVVSDHVSRISNSHDNLEIYESSPQYNLNLIKNLQRLVKCQCSANDVKVIHLVKKDGGFNRLSLKDLNISDNSTIVLVNNSKIPQEYSPYPIAEDFTPNGLPWIQLYHFPQNSVMVIPAEKLNDLSLTPIEEIIFRNALNDIACTDPNILNEKFVTKIDLFVFPGGKNK